VGAGAGAGPNLRAGDVIQWSSTGLDILVSKLLGSILAPTPSKNERRKFLNFYLRQLQGI
jgi:hypothetical protein